MLLSSARLCAVVGFIVVMSACGLAGGGEAHASPAMVGPDTVSDKAALERLLANVSRPSLLMTGEDVQRLRREMAGGGWKRDLYTRYLSAANNWLKNDIQIPARGGHGHLFFCDCGTQLSAPADMLEKPEYLCPACGRKYSGERYDSALRCFRHHQLASAAAVLAVVYSVEDKPEYAAKAAEILSNYADVLPGPHTSPTVGGMLYQSLNEAMWVIPLAQAYDLIYDSGALAASAKTEIEEKLFRPVAEGLIKCGGLGGNWGSWHLSGAGVVGLAIRDASYVDYALKGFRGQMKSVLGSDGIWPESIHCYHFFALMALTHFAEACYGSGIDLYNWNEGPGRGLRTMFASPLDYVYPSFRLPAINDGWYDTWLPLDSYEVAYKRMGGPEFAWVVRSGYMREKQMLESRDPHSLGDLAATPFYRLLFGSDPAIDSPEPDLRSHDYPNFGLCTLRNGDDIMATLHYGKFHGHGHLDKMSFTLYSKDGPLVPDYGTPGYGSKILGWYQGSTGHNTVVVDGKSQQRSKESKLTALFTGDVTQYAQAESSDTYPGVTHTRGMFVFGKACLVSDTLESADVHDYDWLVRCAGQAGLLSQHETTKLDTSSYPLAQIERSMLIGDLLSLAWQGDRGSLVFSMWTDSQEAAVGLGQCPAETDSQKASFVMCRRRGAQARFQALFVPSSRNDDIRVTRDGCVVSIADGSLLNMIYARGVRTESANAALETDGDTAGVRLEDGEVRTVSVLGGSWVKLRGETVLECSSKMNVEVCFGDTGPLMTCQSDKEGTASVRTSSSTIRINGRPAMLSGSGEMKQVRVKL